MKNRKYYGIIVLYCLFLIIAFTGFNNLYGSTTDWISQHSALPEYFRSLFYETGRLVPNFAFNLGAGQNIYNYSYYGLLSPVILISYLLPFIRMTTYIQVVSGVLYILFGIFIFKFINNNFNDDRLSLIVSLIAVSITSINYNFHHHIMFVWYLPFLVLALIGVDKYIKDKKSFLFIISLFLIIMTNYYYSIGSLFSVLLYGIYKILDKNKFNIKKSFYDSFKFGIHFIIPIMMSMIILLPTLLCITSGSRGHSGSDLISLLIPNFKELFYNPVGLGINCFFLVSIVFNLFKNKKDKSNLFINICLLFILLFPMFSYVLNGFLYARGKVLIPFIPLFLYAFSMFYKDFLKNKINYKLLVAFMIILIIISSIFKHFNLVFIIDILLVFIFIYISIKRNNKYYLIGYIFISCIIALFVSNNSEEYVTRDYYEKVSNSGISELYKNIEDDSIYRSYNDLVPKVDINKAYGSKYYSTGIYSSTYNSDYWKFYNFFFGNNMKYRNMLITSGSDNDLFYTFMGVKYITSPSKDSLYYKKIGSNNGINLYYNEDSYPLMYVPLELGDYKELDSLEFPYNIEALLNKAYVDNSSDDSRSNDSKIIKADIEVNDNYDYNFDKKTKIHYDLDNKYNGKILYLKFKMNKNKSCKSGASDDLSITINGVKNKLTCGGYIYHNQNNVFEFVIPIIDSTLGLDVVFTKGEYNLGDIEMFYSEKLGVKNVEVNDIVFDKNKDIITGNIKLDSDNYVITSIPYDSGFSVFVNDKKVSLEKVNKSFLGFKVNKGDNNILIKYESPGFKLSLIITGFGYLLFLMILSYENISIFRKKR